jgi:DNA mismatch repair ATPase MutS
MYVTAAVEIASRLPLKDPIFKSMEFLDPLVAFSPIKNSETEIATLAAKFSQFIEITNLTLEWHKLPSSFNEIENENFKKMPIDKMWLTMEKQRILMMKVFFPI